MTFVTQLMLVFLIVCAIAVCLTRNLLTSVIIYMGYSMIMSIIWITLESPDLPITEAAVGAGVSSGAAGDAPHPASAAQSSAAVKSKAVNRFVAGSFLPQSCGAGFAIL